MIYQAKLIVSRVAKIWGYSWDFSQSRRCSLTTCSNVIRSPQFLWLARPSLMNGSYSDCNMSSEFDGFPCRRNLPFSNLALLNWSHGCSLLLFASSASLFTFFATKSRSGLCMNVLWYRSTPGLIFSSDGLLVCPNDSLEP